MLINFPTLFMTSNINLIKKPWHPIHEMDLSIGVYFIITILNNTFHSLLQVTVRDLQLPYNSLSWAALSSDAVKYFPETDWTYSCQENLLSLFMTSGVTQEEWKVYLILSKWLSTTIHCTKPWLWSQHRSVRNLVQTVVHYQPTEQHWLPKTPTLQLN